jgi:hypothetical protein
MTRHAPSVYRAAREGFCGTLATYKLPRPHDDGDTRGILARIQGSVGFHVQHPGREREALAWILGASAVPAVLRLRARADEARRCKEDAGRVT